MKKIATMKKVATLTKKSLLLAECRTTSSLSLGRRALNLRRAKQMVGLVAIELVLEDEVWSELGLAIFLGLLMIFSLIHESVWSLAREPKWFRVVLVRPPWQRRNGPIDLMADPLSFRVSVASSMGLSLFNKVIGY